MEITTKERYFYLTTMPLIVASLMFLLIYYAPWHNPKKICDNTEIISTELGSDLPDAIFKIGEPIRLISKPKENYKIENYNWYFGKNHELISGSKILQGNVVQYSELGFVKAEVRLNGACRISKELEIAHNCDDGIRNGDETGIDCGGSICDDCKVVKAERKRNPIRKKDTYEILISDRFFECNKRYTFRCVNRSKNDRIEEDILWIFDMVDTEIRGNPAPMTFTNKEYNVDHTIAAFSKKGRLLAKKRISVKCDDI